MDDDQFQGGLSGQGGNPVPANNSNTYDFTNGDPLANLDNPEAAAAESDPADGIAVDPLANEPIMDLTNNVNISAPEAPVESEATAPAEEPEGPISEMSRRMDEELGNISEPVADVPTAEPVAPVEPVAEPAPVSESPIPEMEPVSPAMPTMEAAMPVEEPAAAPAPQILGPEPNAPETTPESNVEASAMSFETTEIPGQTPAPAQSDDIPSLTGESRPSIAMINDGGKKPNKNLIIILIAVVVLIGGVIAAMMIIPNLNSGKKSNKGGNSSSQQSEAPTTDPDDNNGSDDDDDDEDVIKTQVVGRVDKGYVTIPTTWKQVLDANDETLVKYTDEKGDFTVFLNAGPIKDVTAEGFANLQLSYSKEEAKDPETLAATEKTIGDYSMTEIKYFSTATNKYTYKYVFESAKSGYTYFIWMECSDEKSVYFSSIPKSFATEKK